MIDKDWEEKRHQKLMAEMRSSHVQNIVFIVVLFAILLVVFWLLT